MRILIATQYFLPTIGGQQFSTYQLAIELIKLNHQVTILTFNKGKISNLKHDISELSIIRLQTNFEIGRSNFSVNLITHVKNIINKHDVIHVNIPSPILLEFIAFYSYICKKPLFISERGEPDIESIYKKILYKFYQKIIFPISLKYASVFHATTQSYAKSINFFDKIRSKIIIIPHGYNPFYNSNQNLMSSVEFLDRYFLFVGNLHKDNYYKGVPILIHAYNYFISSTKSERKLIIVGDGDLRSKYEALSKKIASNENIIFLGELNNFELVKIYSKAIALIVPSTKGPESFGIVIIEAFSKGVPVIASHIPGIDDIVSHFENGMLVDPNNVLELSKAMKLISTDEALWKKLSRNSLISSKKYQWDFLAKKYEEIYSAI